MANGELGGCEQGGRRESRAKGREERAKSASSKDGQAECSSGQPKDVNVERK